MRTNLLLKYTRKVVSQHVLNIATYDVICSNYRIVSLLFQAGLHLQKTKASYSERYYNNSIGLHLSYSLLL